jgi:8-oxo-dGTP diphosphatase
MSFRSASIVIILKNNYEFLSVSLPNDHTDMNMPGGMVEKNESPIQAGIREVKEETGLDVKNLKFLYKNIEDKTLVYTYYTFDYSGEINTIEKHKIEWLPLEVLKQSKSWPEYNTKCYDLLKLILN